MTPYQKQDPQTIQSLFDAIAPGYDLTNQFMSLNLHKNWNRALIKTALSPYAPSTYIDLCAGTGEIALGYLNQNIPHCQTYLIDFSQNMLEVAKAKLERDPRKHPVKFLQADVQKLPLENELADAATIAYGIRNVKEPLKCFQEVFRVLKNDGSFGILELTRPKNPLLKFGHSLYLKYLIPLFGKWVTKDRLAYEYLCKSIEHFSEPAELSSLLEQAGFTSIKIKPLHFGIATLIHARKQI